MLAVAQCQFASPSLNNLSNLSNADSTLSQLLYESYITPTTDWTVHDQKEYLDRFEMQHIDLLNHYLK